VLRQSPVFGGIIHYYGYGLCADSSWLKVGGVSGSVQMYCESALITV
jgi:hypothetical protein